MKGILFKPEMIRAIMKGNKTQTRRVIKLDPSIDWELIDAGEPIRMFRDGAECLFVKPRYQVGETVYIKEKLQKIGDYAIYFSDAHSVMFYRSLNRLHWRWQKHWLSPIHCPEEAARYFLKIKEARVERLQEMTEDDAIAEGIYGDEGYYEQASPTMCFEALWDSINKAYPWHSNPWVWRYEFQLIPHYG